MANRDIPFDTDALQSSTRTPKDPLQMVDSKQAGDGIGTITDSVKHAPQDASTSQPMVSTKLSAASAEFKMPSKSLIGIIGTPSPSSSPQQREKGSHLPPGRRASNENKQKNGSEQTGRAAPNGGPANQSRLTPISKVPPQRFSSTERRSQSNRPSGASRSAWSPGNAGAGPALDPAQIKMDSQTEVKESRDISQAWVAHQRKTHQVPGNRNKVAVKTPPSLTKSLTVSEKLDGAQKEIESLRNDQDLGLGMKKESGASLLVIPSELEGTPRGSSEEAPRPSHSSSRSQSSEIRVQLNQNDRKLQDHVRQTAQAQHESHARKAPYIRAPPEFGQSRRRAAQDTLDPDFDRSLPVRKGSLGRLHGRSKLFDPDQDLAAKAENLSLEQTRWSSNWRSANPPLDQTGPEAVTSKEKLPGRGRHPIAIGSRELNKAKVNKHVPLPETTDGARLFDYRKDDPLKYNQSPVARAPVSTQAMIAHNEPWFDDQAVIGKWVETIRFPNRPLVRDMLEDEPLFPALPRNNAMIEPFLEKLENVDVRLKNAQKSVTDLSAGDMTREMKSHGYNHWSDLVHASAELGSLYYETIMFLHTSLASEDFEGFLNEHRILSRLWTNGYVDMMSFLRNYMSTPTEGNDVQSDDPLLIDLAHEIMTSVAIEQYSTYLCLYDQLPQLENDSPSQQPKNSTVLVRDHCLDRLPVICKERGMALAALHTYQLSDTERPDVRIESGQWLGLALRWYTKAIEQDQGSGLLYYNLGTVLSRSAFQLQAIFFFVKR